MPLDRCHSSIFYTREKQRAVALDMIPDLEPQDYMVVPEVVPVRDYWEASPERQG
jgi:hypothetical protein